MSAEPLEALFQNDGSREFIRTLVSSIVEQAFRLLMDRLAAQNPMLVSQSDFHMALDGVLDQRFDALGKEFHAAAQTARQSALSTDDYWGRVHLAMQIVTKPAHEGLDEELRALATKIVADAFRDEAA